MLLRMDFHDRINRSLEPRLRRPRIFQVLPIRGFTETVSHWSPRLHLDFVRERSKKLAGLLGVYLQLFLEGVSESHDRRDRDLRIRLCVAGLEGVEERDKGLRLTVQVPHITYFDQNWVP